MQAYLNQLPALKDEEAAGFASPVALSFGESGTDVFRVFWPKLRRLKDAIKRVLCKILYDRRRLEF